MTIIKNMHLRGFKSFAKSTNLEFGEGYNCVIGANGSGKSNIMDALCFVLGKISAKAMRAQKAANLIFNGGKKGNPLKEAEVAIMFTNENKEFPLPTKEVKISRIVRQTGNSIYKINNEVRTREQILELLSGARIDPDGHSVILQGDITRFMEMKTEQRREVIEEISGISVYEDRKAKALNELEKVGGKLNEAKIILTEREAYMKELKKDRDQALKYKELEKNTKSNKATVLHIQIKEKEEKIAEIDKQIEKRKKDIEEINKNIEEKSEKESVSLQKEVENVRAEIIRQGERSTTIKNDIEKISARKKQTQISLVDVENTIIYLEKTKKEISGKIEELSAKEKKIAKTIEEFKKKHNIGDFEDLEGLENEIDQKLIQLKKLQNEKESVLQKKFEIDAKVINMNEKMRSYLELEKESNIKGLRQDYENVTNKYSKTKNEIIAIQHQLEKSKSELMKYDGELFKLRAMRTNMEESILFDKAIKKILSLKKPGVFGTVSQLGKVESKYSLALDVAAAGRVKSIVVKDDNIAAECIAILKHEKAGTATFLPLNKIKGRPKMAINGSGVHGSALDLISFDSKFKDIFSYVFGNTVVVDSIAVARHVGIGKTRMVTLEGDLVEMSGAMIGGYRTKNITGVGFQKKDVTKDLQVHEKKVNELEKIKTTLEKRKNELEAREYELSKKKNSFEGEIIKVEKSLDFDITKVKEEKEDLLKNVVFDQLYSVEQSIEMIEKEINELKKQREKMKGKLIDSRDPDVGNSLKSLEAKRQKTREENIQIQTDLKNIDMQLTNIYHPEKEKYNKQIKELEDEYAALRKEDVELNKKGKVKQNELQLMESKEVKFQKEYKDLFTRRTKFGDETRKIEFQIVQEEGKSRLITERMNDVSINRARIIGEMEGLNKEFEEFKGVELRRNVPLEKMKEDIRKFEKMLSDLGNVNLRALEVYESIEKEYQSIVEKTERLAREKEDVLQMMYEIETRKKDLFMETFNIIADHFTRIFSMLSTKGQALLELENKEDPLSEGVEIKVRLTGNKFLDIKSLSGGEKTLAALAFIFAIQEHKPASFYLMDEVDAALDKKNSELLSKFIAKYADRAQYILISHNDQVITEANYIYGVSMQENGMSKVVSLRV